MPINISEKETILKLGEGDLQLGFLTKNKNINGIIFIQQPEKSDKIGIFKPQHNIDYNKINQQKLLITSDNIKSLEIFIEHLKRYKQHLEEKKEEN